jgi:hypothetical protein
MADNGTTVLPIMPITWGILAVIVLASYLISKLADLCFDHYLINYTDYEHRDMIKARFQGEMKNLFIFKKKVEDIDENKGKQKISILPIIVNEVKREMKRVQKLEEEEEAKKKEIIEDNKMKLNDTLVVPTSHDSINSKDKLIIKNVIIKPNVPIKPTQKIINNIPKIHQQKNVQPKIINKPPNGTQSNNNNQMSSRNENFKALVRIDETTAREENNRSNMKNPHLVQLWSNHPYNEKFIEKHQENKKKLLKEKLKIFTVHKSASNVLLKLQSDDHNSIMDEFKLSDVTSSSFNIDVSKSMHEIISTSDTCSSGENELSNFDNDNLVMIGNNVGRKKILVKQSTIETTLSSENYYQK